MLMVKCDHNLKRIKILHKINIFFAMKRLLFIYIIFNEDTQLASKASLYIYILIIQHCNSRIV